MRTLALRCHLSDVPHCPGCRCPLSEHNTVFRLGCALCVDCATYCDQHGARIPRIIADRLGDARNTSINLGLIFWTPRTDLGGPGPLHHGPYGRTNGELPDAHRGNN